MKSAASPPDEAARLAALRALDVLDTPAEAEFDALVQAASTVCGTPISLVSLVDEDRQWFKANHGLGGSTETPRDIAFCAHAILDNELFVVQDASSDERFADNPLVIGSPDIRFYAGAPVRLSDGHRVGTLCVIDRRPRQLDATQREVLLSLSKAVSRALEGRHAAKRLREAMNALEVQREMLDAMLRSIEDAVLATDATGRIHWASPAAERLLGRSARKLEGRSLRRAVALRSSSDRHGIAAVLSAAAEGRSAPLQSNALLHTAAGQTVAIEGVASAMRPVALMSAAERYQLMARIDRWVLRRTLAWMAGRHLHGPLHRVSVNLSGQSVADPIFRTWALQSLEEAGKTMCERLTLEITETVAIARLEEAGDFVRAMQSTGARVALDDFGVGASTFGYLKTLPVDYLKIDGQFIRHLLTDPLDQTAVKCFVDVARTVGLKTVAEHVETDAVLERLRELGVDFAQGCLLHRPASLDAACRDGACAAPVAKPSPEPASPRSMVMSQTKA